MLKGDLSSTTLASVLIDLAAESSSGALVMNHPDGEEVQIYLRSGLVCGLHAPDRRSDLGAKLVSSGVLEPEALADALEAQRTDLSSWNLGELLVHLGYVESNVIQGFVTEQLHETLWDLMRWTEGSWKFRKNAKTREDGQAISVVELLQQLRERGYEWENIAEIVDSPNAVPMLSARGDGAPETTLDSDAWSMLCKIDGMRTVAELAADCGYTLFEAGQVLVALVDAGLVDITDDADGEEDVYGSASALAGALAGARSSSHDVAAAAPAAANGAGDDALSRLARLAADVTTAHVSAEAPTTPNPLQLDVMAAQLSGGANLTVPVSRKSGESFAAAMGRVAGSLADALGPAPEQIDNDPIVVKRRPKAPKREDESIDLEEQRKRRRAAAAAELAQAQAAVESLRPDRKFDVPVTEAPPRLVDLEAERARVAARDAEEAARHATEGAAREAAEKFAREVAEQAARIQLEQAARESQDRAEEAARLAAEQAAAEQAAAEQAAAEEAARLAAEQAAAEEAARLAAEEAERLAAERAAAEEAARLAAEQLKAEQEARVAAEAAARLAAEELKAAKEARAAAEEAARVAAEEAAAEEAARLAAEQAAAQEEQRRAAEEAERLAAEAAERAEAEAERRAAEAAAEAEAAAAAEAERIAQEAADAAEAERRAAEEAERAAQEEVARQAAEEAERLAAAQAAEAVRVAEEAEARAALAAAQAEAEAQAEAARLLQQEAELAAAKLKAEEAERIALQEAIAKSQASAEAAAATAMLVELHHDDVPEPAVDIPAAAASPDPVPDEPTPIRRGEDADTAALLRELSSLGLDEQPDSGSLAAATPPPRPRPTPADKKVKKKIGLFGL